MVLCVAFIVGVVLGTILVLVWSTQGNHWWALVLLFIAISYIIGLSENKGRRW